MRTRACIVVAWLTASAVAGAPSSGGAQDTGAVDTRPGIDEQIYKLEQMLAGDTSAEKQAVALRWLADLYTSIGRLDLADDAYARILDFFPRDLATSNAYAVFLMEKLRSPERAEKALHDAIEWANAQDTPPPYLGRTYALHAASLLDLGRHDDALQAADRALELLDEDAAEDAMRVRARCLADLGRQKDARGAYLTLIGLTADSNPDDKAALLALNSGAKGVDARKFDASLARAVKGARDARAEAARAEGAEIVELKGDGGVRLEGTLRKGETSAAILFVPDLGARRSAFNPYAQLISIDGVTTLTVDPRGHGDSRADSLPSYEAMPERHRASLPSDVADAWRYLRETGAERIAIVVEGRACAVVEQAAHEHGVSAVVVHLSPTFGEDDRELSAALSFRPPQPMMAVASDEDVFAMRSLALLRTRATTTPAPADGARATIDTHVFSFAGHGVQILRDPANFAVIVTWVRNALGLPE